MLRFDTIPPLDRRGQSDDLQGVLALLGLDRSLLLFGPAMMGDGLGFYSDMHTGSARSGVRILFGDGFGKRKRRPVRTRTKADFYRAEMIELLSAHFLEVREFDHAYDLAVAREDAWPKVI